MCISRSLNWRVANSNFDNLHRSTWGHEVSMQSTTQRVRHQIWTNRMSINHNTTSTTWCLLQCCITSRAWGKQPNQDKRQINQMQADLYWVIRQAHAHNDPSHFPHQCTHVHEAAIYPGSAHEQRWLETSVQKLSNSRINCHQMKSQCSTHKQSTQHYWSSVDDPTGIILGEYLMSTLCCHFSYFCATQA